jgi:hypothetical protein
MTPLVCANAAAAQSAAGWSFYIFSSGGSPNHAWLRDLEVKWSEELRLLCHFFP